MTTKQPLRVLVETFKVEMGGIDHHPYVGPVYVLESTKHINHNDSSDRKWLGTHCFWAMRNNRRVTTTPIA